MQVYLEEDTQLDTFLSETEFAMTSTHQIERCWKSPLRSFCLDWKLHNVVTNILLQRERKYTKEPCKYLRSPTVSSATARVLKRLSYSANNVACA